jgi:putative ubiquitin-RnfH superfamily antitoxin RatB of RatAB toxin-antitoxin module
MIAVTVCYATLEKQVEIPVMVSENCTIESAIIQSKIIEQLPEIDLTKNPVGVFNERVALHAIAKADDRIEIYRPLKINPKDRRLLKAANK